MMREIIGVILILGVCIFVGVYAGEEKGADRPTNLSPDSPEEGAETCVLGSLTNIYQPVTFSHETHTYFVDSCAMCHHHSPPDQTPPCRGCHGAQAKLKDLEMPGLKDAYHGQCISCHKELGAPTGCTECHAKRIIPKAPKKKPGKGPETSILSSLIKIYHPVTFFHEMHTLVTEDCATCHHHSELDQTPACKECHGAPFNPENLNMPGLKGAYHLQCMGCHKEMGSGPTGCDECHAKKARKEKEAKNK